MNRPVSVSDFGLEIPLKGGSSQAADEDDKQTSIYGETGEQPTVDNESHRCVILALFQ